jgi:Tfp pilus assembly protein PilV
MSARRNEAGFTLLEVMIAAVILVTGMVSLLGLFAMALSLHRKSLDTTNSALIAREILPTLKRDALRRDEKRGYHFVDVAERDLPGHPGYRYAATFRATGGPPPETLAEVWIYWTARGRARAEVFRSVVLAEPEYRDLIRQEKEKRKP